MKRKFRCSEETVTATGTTSTVIYTWASKRMARAGRWTSRIAATKRKTPPPKGEKSSKKTLSSRVYSGTTGPASTRKISSTPSGPDYTMAPTWGADHSPPVRMACGGNSVLPHEGNDAATHRRGMNRRSPSRWVDRRSLTCRSSGKKDADYVRLRCRAHSTVSPLERRPKRRRACRSSGSRSDATVTAAVAGVEFDRRCCRDVAGLWVSAWIFSFFPLHRLGNLHKIRRRNFFHFSVGIFLREHKVTDDAALFVDPLPFHHVSGSMIAPHGPPRLVWRECRVWPHESRPGDWRCGVVRRGSRTRARRVGGVSAARGAPNSRRSCGWCGRCGRGFLRCLRRVALGWTFHGVRATSHGTGEVVWKAQGMFPFCVHAEGKNSPKFSDHLRTASPSDGIHGGLKEKRHPSFRGQLCFVKKSRAHFLNKILRIFMAVWLAELWII